MKVIIVGGGACGASCATRLRRLDESCEITILERTNEVSIANCGLPYYCSNVINDRDRILVSNPKKFKGDKIMKIVIPSADEKLCGHFGHCEYITFVEVNPESKEILNIEKKVPEEGISCQSANWIASQGANVVLAGGMGGRPMAIFAQNGVKIVAGCPELGIEEVVKQYLNDTLLTGENSCGGEHHHCHGHHHEHQHGKNHCHQ